ncbi:MAG: hypothetical protein LQ348_002430 [Seirophora lacunosa]|nr:MAG: hypothetical protein LQ348_002430 [Seirophora lacunosa]
MLLPPLQTSSGAAHVFPHPLRIPPPFLLATEQAPPSPISTALQTTCLELQRLIATSHHRSSPSSASSRTVASSPPAQQQPSSLQSPIDFRTTTTTRPFPLRAKTTKTANRIEKPKPMKSTLLRAANHNNNNNTRPPQITVPKALTGRFATAGEKENLAGPAPPRTPTATSHAPPVLPLGLGREDFEGLRRGEEEGEMEDGHGHGQGGKRMELSRCDEALVGLLLKQMRLRR